MKKNKFNKNVEFREKYKYDKKVENFLKRREIHEKEYEKENQLRKFIYDMQK